MIPKFWVYPDGYLQDIDNSPPIIGFSAEERLKTLKNVEGKVCPIAKAIINGTVVHTASEKKFAELIGEEWHGGQQSSFFDHSYSSFCLKWLFGFDSIGTCGKEDHHKIKNILDSHLKGLDEGEWFKKWRNQIDSRQGTWMKSQWIDLKEEMASLVCSCCGEEILGIGERNTAPLAKAMYYWTNAVLNTNVSMMQKGIEKTLAAWSLWSITSIIHKEAVLTAKEAQEAADSKVTFGAALLKYFKDEKQWKAPQAIKAIEHNYLFVLFNYYEPVSLLLTAILWELAKNVPLQKEYAQIAEKAEKFLNEGKAAEYMQALSPFSQLLEEGLRMYSPSCIDRVMKHDTFLEIEKDKGSLLKRGEHIVYWPYAAGYNEEDFILPQRFAPMRFEDANLCPEAVGKKYAHHFGNNAVSCPGKLYARERIKIALAFMLKRYIFTTEQQKLNLIVSQTLKCAEPVIVKVEPRWSSIPLNS